MNTTTRRRLWLILGMLALCVFVAVLTVVLNLALTADRVRNTQVDNTQKADERDSTLLLLQDCVRPGGKCFERGQRQTAKAVGDISKANAIAAAAASTCAVRMTDATFDRVYECTVRTVEKASRKQAKP